MSNSGIGSSLDLWSAGNLVIRTEDQQPLFESDLSFPDALLEDAAKFDQLVNELADRASKRKPHSPVPLLKPLFSRLAVAKEYQSVIEATFRTMCRLHDDGRDHIWGYSPKPSTWEGNRACATDTIMSYRGSPEIIA